MNQDTIAAVATPIGSGGIGVVKISGVEALEIAARLFVRQSPTLSPEPVRTGHRDRSTDINDLENRRMYYGWILDRSQKQIVDEVLLVIMRAPNSYTCEDVVEIQAHSGAVGLNKILDLVLTHGARLAEPGEFTKRAFLNGRIDLTQAEAVIDIINAKSSSALQMALQQNTGMLAKQINACRQTLVDILADITARIDFPDDLADPTPDPRINAKIKDVRDQMTELLKAYQGSRIIREGMTIAIAGRTNVGKSSLMNCLVQKDRAIVTDIPGTTRDLIEDHLQIGGVPYIITDTAGLQHTDDPVEIIGISKSQEAIDSVDLVLIVIDAATGVTPTDIDIVRRCRDKATVIVVNKIDMAPEFDLRHVSDVVEGASLPICPVSAKYHQGIDLLKDTISELTHRTYQLDNTQRFPINLRHKQALEAGLAAISAAENGMRAGYPDEIIAIDLNDAMAHLDDVLGANSSEALLDHIFSRFCIGK